jgi:triosephosphate isomerase
MKPLIVLNWKMNPLTHTKAVALVKASSGAVVCPPFPYLEIVRKANPKVILGAQDVFFEKEGAYTGAVAPGMLNSVGVRYVILGHSERRIHFGETNELIAKKIEAALQTKLIPILCVGEPEEIERQGMQATEKYLSQQLFSGIERISREAKVRMVIAYEPIWAISTNPGARSDSPERAAAVASFIRRAVHDLAPHLSLQILYGGSVKGKTCSAFLKEKEIDGVLVGGASLVPKEIQQILKAL